MPASVTTTVTTSATTRGPSGSITSAAATRVPAAYALMMARDADQCGLDLLSDFNLSLQDIENKQFIDIDLSQSITALYAAWKADDPDWGFEFGHRLGMASHGPLGFGALSAATVGDGLKLFAEFIQTRAFQYRCSVDAEGDVAEGEGLVLRFALHDGVAGYSSHLCEALSTIFQSYIETVGASAAPTLWSFPYAEPDNSAHYGRWLKGGYRFGTEVLELRVPGSVAMVVSPFKDDAAYRSCRAQCEALLAANSDSLEHQVAAILSVAMNARAIENVPVTPIPVIEDVATELDMSRRTLIRKLQQGESSFQAIKDTILKEQILAMLDQSVSLQRIADKLGYCDAANFSRACRRLFGQPPSALRLSGK